MPTTTCFKRRTADRRAAEPIVAALALLFAGLALSGCSDQQGGEQRSAPSVIVEVTTVERQQMIDAVRGVGTLRASSEVEISPEVAGRITALEFREGGRVERGQVLVRLRDSRLREQLTSREAALSAARSRARNAERTYERVASLRAQRQVSEGDYEQALTDMQGAQAEVQGIEADIAAIREQLADMVIRAPFDGEISQQHVDEGAFVEVGRRIATLYRTDPLYIGFSIPERYAGRVTLDNEVQVSVASFPGEQFPATLDLISPSIDERSRTLGLRATVPNPDGRLRPGSFGTARLIVERLDDLAVLPEEALIGTRDGYIVFVVEGDKARRRAVTTGLREDGIVAITEGLEPGEIVVQRGHSRISDGTSVEISGDGAAPDGR
ncbi:MAG: efflux RND transporter periplasmic adaptor subunit [Gammaproteobacteria bacterium]|nr:efflux RND transporter periplasmic adaptor subunit [Gammaproteobacteria bacterium]